MADKDNFPDLKLNDGSKALDPNNNDYFLVTITDLLPGKTYPIEFRWNYKDPSKKGDWGAVLNITTTAYAPDAITNLSATWENEIFKLSFTHDRTLAANKNVLYYKVKIVAQDSTERVFQYLPKTGSSQVFSLEYSRIVEAFGIPLSAFSGSVIAVDKDGNESTAVTFPLTSATTSLPAPVITVAAASGGYTVSYTTPSSSTYPNYHHINVEEVESSAGSDPGSGYSVVFSGVANPVILSRSTGAQRWVRARFYSKLGLPGAYSTAYAVTPTPAVVVDTIAPSAPGSGSLSSGIDNTDGATIGFNAYVDVSWNAVSDSTLRGYRIRFRRNGSSDPYSYVDSPGSGTSYRLSGLAIGTTYEIGIASYDEINNTSSSYTSLGTATATGTPFIGKNVTTQGYFGASATGDTGEFRFGYGVESGRRGLRFDANNYWYIDSSAAASFRLGGSANNYLQWNGSTFTIDGNVTARSGEFRGNVQIVSGSLFAGASASSGARLAISSTGLTAYDSNGSPTTNIYGNAGVGGVTFTTSAGTIGNWSITNSSITKTSSSGTLTLDSTNAKITASSGSYFSGLQAPVNNLPGDIVFFAGSSSPASAPFRVRADGGVTMTSATITGYATGDQLTATNNTVATKIGAADVNTNVTSISGGVITAGTINLNNVNVNNGTGSNSIQISSAGLELYNGSGTRIVYLSASNGSASFSGNITSSSINVTGESFSSGTNDGEGTSGINTGQSNAFTSSYVRDNITNLGINGISLMSANTAGVISSWYPYFDGAVDLGIKSGATYNTYRWRNLRLTGNAYFGGDGSTNSVGPSVSGGALIKIYSTGEIYANTLGVASGTTLVQSSGGYIRVSSSSRRYKENIVEINKLGYLDIINQLKPVNFNYKQEFAPDDYTVLVSGLIAEDVDEIDELKTIVNYNHNGDPESIAYDRLSAILVLAIQEIKNKLNSIEQRLDALEG